MLERIRELRNEMNISQALLAEKMGISLSALATYERGERDPGATLVIKMADYFKVTSDYLLGLSDRKGEERQYGFGLPKETAITIDDINDSINDMFASASFNPFGLKTLDAYAVIIELLTSIDDYAMKQLRHLKSYNIEFERFGAEAKLLFNGEPLLIALVNGSEEATEFARNHTIAINRIYEYINEVSGFIEKILSTTVYDAIKGQSLEGQPGYVEQLLSLRGKMREKY